MATEGMVFAKTMTLKFKTDVLPIDAAHPFVGDQKYRCTLSERKASKKHQTKEHSFVSVNCTAVPKDSVNSLVGILRSQSGTPVPDSLDADSQETSFIAST